ncbi:MAG: alpha-amylase family glycosyl hydrolase [Chloroflexota bacterium]|nr:alpha-amylase family glycosyl hydrolase [Chloroflexota bacterium]
MPAPSGEVDPSNLTLWDRTRRLGIELDNTSGLPRAVVAHLADDRQVRHPVQWTATLITEGAEREQHPFGLGYVNTIDFSDFRLASRTVRHDFAGYDELFTVSTEVEGWDVDWEYRFRGSSPRLEIQVVVSPAEGRRQGTLRNLWFQIDFAPDDLSGWTIQAPGSQMRADLPADSITERVQFSESTFSGSGIVVLQQPEERVALLIWPFSRTEHSVNSIQTVDGTVRLEIDTRLAGRVGDGERLRYGSIEIDVFAATWDELRPTAHSWLTTLGIAKPVDTASWTPGSTIFEVQIGTSVFWQGFEYSPYPTMRDLYNDIGRIAGLGFDCIQIMPRQPFPSYNVYDYADITTSYGDENDLRLVVEACHALGMKVILDILMHGVIDADIIHRAADRVRNGPYFSRLNEGTEILPDPEHLAYQGQDYLVSWSRHILDFEEPWAGGSPGEHPLVAEHPEWFVRDSAGAIIGVYTKAFDVANIEWQEYFTDAALDLVRRLDIDGFRFDAPTYNEVPNWSPATEKRASASQLGSVEHFARLRPRLKGLKPEAMLYTEPSGTLFRQTMDITYNYDEHWLIHAVLRPEHALQKNPLGIRHARDLAAWFRDKEAVLPNGAMTARHIDSHDTFWWPLPGFKWRREQYGLPATRALVATWSLIGGVYMTFVGGETELEDDIRRLNRLRSDHPEIRLGAANYDCIQISDDRVFAVARVHDGHVSLVLVNLSNAEVATTASLDVSIMRPDGRTYQVYDAWNDVALHHAAGYVWTADQLAAIAVAFTPYQARVLTIRPAGRRS